MVPGTLGPPWRLPQGIHIRCVLLRMPQGGAVKLLRVELVRGWADGEWLITATVAIGATTAEQAEADVRQRLEGD